MYRGGSIKEKDTALAIMGFLPALGREMPKPDRQCWVIESAVKRMK